jgi:hypothetical protein
VIAEKPDFRSLGDFGNPLKLRNAGRRNTADSALKTTPHESAILQVAKSQARWCLGFFFGPKERIQFKPCETILEFPQASVISFSRKFLPIANFCENFDYQNSFLNRASPPLVENAFSTKRPRGRRSVKSPGEAQNNACFLSWQCYTDIHKLGEII